MRKLVLPLIVLSMLSACQSTADDKDRVAQERITSAAVATVPLPTITRFGKRRTLKAVDEAEDKQIPTYSYHYNSFHSCYTPIFGDAHTFGYPVPGATQMTNPMKWVSGGAVIPQADPDATFTPASEDATYIMHLNKVTGDNDVHYSEDKVDTTTTPVPAEYICHPNQ